MDERQLHRACKGLNPTSSDKSNNEFATGVVAGAGLNPTSSDKRADLAYSKFQRAASAF